MRCSTSPIRPPASSISSAAIASRPCCIRPWPSASSMHQLRRADWGRRGRRLRDLRNRDREVARGPCRAWDCRHERVRVSAHRDGAVPSRTAPGSLRDWTLFECEVLTFLLERAGGIDPHRKDRERTGQPGWRPLRREIGRDPRLGELFDNAMVSMARHVAKDVLAAHDFSRAGSILDSAAGRARS